MTGTGSSHRQVAPDTGPAPSLSQDGVALLDRVESLLDQGAKQAGLDLALAEAESSSATPEHRALSLILAARAERVMRGARHRERALDEARGLLDAARLTALEGFWALEALLWELERSDLARAEEHGYAALSAARWCPGRADWIRATAQSALGRVFSRRGDWKQAARFFQQALAYFEESGGQREASAILANVSRCYFHLGRWSDASDSLRKAAVCFRDFGRTLPEIGCWASLAMVWTAAGDLTAAAEHLARAKSAAGDSAPPRYQALLLEVESDIVSATGRWELSLGLLDRGKALSAASSTTQDVLTEILHRRAVALLHLGRPEAALDEAERAVMMSFQISEPLEQAAALRARGAARAAAGRANEGRSDLDAALSLAVEYGNRLEEARTCEALSLLAAGPSGPGAASIEGASHLHRARSLYASLGCVRDVERVDKELAARQPAASASRRRGRSGVSPEPRFLTEDPRILADFQRLHRATDRILLLGETGTGKELAARVLHHESDRRDGPFIVVDCAATAQGLFESELFGFRKGTFTGAAQDRKGLIESAHGGTLFLDEIGELPLEMQSRLLRVVQERQSRRLGDVAYHDLDFRLIAATNRNLERIVEEGRFRSDLYFRLRSGVMVIPPLRERRGDILLLADHFLELYSERSGRRHSFHADIVRAFQEYAWPGNVRELMSEIESLVLQAPESGEIGSEMLSPGLRGGFSGGMPERKPVFAVQSGRPAHPSAPDPTEARGGTLADRLEAIKRAEVTGALERHGGNRARAARELGITHAGLLKILRRMGGDEVG